MLQGHLDTLVAPILPSPLPLEPLGKLLEDSGASGVASPILAVGTEDFSSPMSGGS